MIQFGLSTIQTTQFAIMDEEYKADEEVQFSVNLQQGIENEKKSLAVRAKVSFAQQKQVFLVIEVVCNFGISNEGWDTFIQKDDSVCVPRKFFIHLGMLTVGTLRGVLHAKTENNDFNKYVVPIVDVTEIIKEDVVFIINQ